MAYDAVERSVEGGNPVELYQFSRSSQTYYYTSANEVIQYLTVDYQPLEMNRSNITQSDELQRGPITVKVPRDSEIAAEFVAGSPPEPVSLTVFRVHRSDNDFIVHWKGRVLSASFKDSFMEMKCEPIQTSLQRDGLNRYYQNGCPHVLYGDKCRVSGALFRITDTVQAVNNQVVITGNVFNTQANGWWVGGMLKFSDGSDDYYRMVTDHVGNDITILYPAPLTLGTTIEVFAGCDHTLSTCVNKFNNAPNYGGFPYVPVKNPFNGDAII